MAKMAKMPKSIEIWDEIFQEDILVRVINQIEKFCHTMFRPKWNEIDNYDVKREGYYVSPYSINRGFGVEMGHDSWSI